MFLCSQSASLRSMALFLKYNFTLAITIFVALILGNQVPVYPVDNHTNHGTHVSVQNQRNASIEDDGASGNNSSKYAEQIIANCQDGNEHCPMMALDKLNKTASHQTVLETFSD